MNRRKVEIIAAIALLILLVAFIAWLLLREPRGGEEEQTPEQNIATDDLPPVNPEDIPQQSEVAAVTVSRTFIERFGSYSSESDFANIDDVMPLATARFRAELEGLVRQYRASLTGNEEYNGISTFVISTQAVNETETSMALRVTTQRRESVGNPGNSSLRYQDVEIALVKEGEDWRVDGLTWK